MMVPLLNSCVSDFRGASLGSIQAYHHRPCHEHLYVGPPFHCQAPGGTSGYGLSGHRPDM